METNAPIPRYYLYGRLDDDAGEVEIDFLHIEPIQKRSGPNNWTISPHAHPAHVQVLFVRRGGGSIEIEGGEIPIAVPALMVVPTAAVHQIRFLPDTDGWVITAADSYLTRAAQGDNRLIETTRHAGVFALEGTDLDPRSVETLFEQLMREFVYSAPGRRPAVTAYFSIVLVTVMRARAGKAGPGVAADDRTYSLVLRYRDLLERHFRAERRISFYADALAVTPARLNAACHARLGTTASGLLHDRIVTEAKRWLLYTGMTVADVGYALGFDDPAYFSRFFSKRVGIAPGRLREAMGGQPPVEPSPSQPELLETS